MPGGRKLELAFEANELSRQLAMAGLRSRYPDAGPGEIFRRLMDLTLGPKLANTVYGPLGEDP